MPHKKQLSADERRGAMILRRGGVLGVWMLLFWALTALAAGDRPGFEAEVRWVADGDTVILKDGRRLRYVGINCPETAHDGNPAEPFGTTARRLNQNLVDGGTIRCVPAGHDRYGRLLGAVFLPDGTFVNRELLAAGLGYVLPGEESAPFAEHLLSAQRQAMAQGRGIWKYLDRNPQSLVGNRRSKRFHRIDGPDAQKIGKRNRVAFPDYHEAFAAGYAPCGRCFPRLEGMLVRGGRDWND
jgi:endonuclease YncB( thermonuclease family)